MAEGVVARFADRKSGMALGRYPTSTRRRRTTTFSRTGPAAFLTPWRALQVLQARCA
jgi:hypothetical protein